MTEVAVESGKPLSFRDFLVWMAVLFFLALGTHFLTSSGRAADVTIKPCQTCPSCSCKPFMGGMRCGCPR